MHHPVVGDLHLDFDTMTLAAGPSLAITVYAAAPDSPTAERLQLLGSWMTMRTEDAHVRAGEPHQ